MLGVKIGMCILYVILGYVAVARPLTIASQFSQGLLLILVLAHVAECALYRDSIRRAPGSAWWHLLNVFLFGIIHKFRMDSAIKEFSS